MAGVNKVILLGHLGADPEVKYLEGDKVVANLSLATSEAYQDRNGNRVEQTEWHDLELWDQQAKVAEKYLKKGSQIYVEGKIKSDKWTDEQGQNRKRIKIRGLSFTMVGGKPEGMPTAPGTASTAQSPASSTSASVPTMSLEEGDDDLPF